jgi:hypothetical protein
VIERLDALRGNITSAGQNLKVQEEYCHGTRSAEELVGKVPRKTSLIIGRAKLLS